MLERGNKMIRDQNDTGHLAATTGTIERHLQISGAN